MIFFAKASLRIGCGNPGSGLMFLQGQINDQHISMLVDIRASHLFMSPQMLKSLGLVPMRVDNPIEVRFAKGDPQMAGRVVGNVPIKCGRRKEKKVLPYARWTTSVAPLLSGPTFSQVQGPLENHPEPPNGL